MNNQLKRHPSEYQTITHIRATEHVQDNSLWYGFVVPHVFMVKNHKMHGLSSC